VCALLVGLQAALGALAVAVGRDMVPPWAALGLATLLLGSLAVATAGAALGLEAAGRPRRLAWAAAGAAAVLILLAAPAVLAVLRAMGPARTGATLARRALVAAGQGRSGEAVADFSAAGASLRQARARLDAPLASLGLAIPGLASNLSASRTLVATGVGLSEAGARVTAVAQASEIHVARGAVPLDDVARLTPTLASAVEVLRTFRGRLAAADRPYLVPPLERAVDDLSQRLTRETQSGERAAEGARLAPALMGRDGVRRYFVALQNNAELRATGGLIGNWAELVAERGRLRLNRFGRLQELNDGGTRPKVLHASPEFEQRYRDFDVANTWQQVNVSPDFPTTARVIADLYPQSGGQPVDGVVAVDPPGLAALLDLTGPVQVPGWPEPVTAANVVDVTLRGAYERFPDSEQRAAFLGEVSRRVFEAFTSASLGSPSSIARALGRASQGDHLLVWFAEAQEEELSRRLGTDGAVRAVEGDSLLVVDQNLSANKVDLYLHRRLRYEVALDPSRNPAALRGRLEVTLDNQAPAGGLPKEVIGPFDARFAPGESRTLLSLYSPFAYRSATIDRRPLPLETQPELGRLAGSATVSIPPGQARIIRAEVRGRVALAPRGWYRLDLGHQPVINPDQVDVSVVVPRGWRIADSRGLGRSGDRRATVRLRLDRERSLLVRVERSGWSGFWHRLFQR
jgi:hypothetical protein